MVRPVHRRQIDSQYQEAKQRRDHHSVHGDFPPRLSYHSEIITRPGDSRVMKYIVVLCCEIIPNYSCLSLVKHFGP